MEAEYFVVGPRFVLRSVAPADGAVVRLGYGERGEVRGVMEARPEDGCLRLALDGGAPADPGARAELYRLFARVCVRLGDPALPLRVHEPDDGGALGAALRADGFATPDGVRWTRGRRPFVRPAERKADTMEDVYADFFHVPWNFVPRERDVLDELRAGSLRAAPGARVLDLGCGSGKNAVLLEESGFEVYGIDVSPTAVARCRTLVSHPERFVATSATRLPWPGGTFHRVLDLGCLHCMPADERPAAVAEIARVLAPGGVLLSRIFKPRAAEWLAAQPFRTDAFGMPPEEAAALLSPCFDVRTWKDDPEVNHLACHPR